MVVGVHKRGVGVFSNRRDVEHALHDLKNTGFDMDRVSVITQDGDKDDIAGAEVSDRVGDKSDEGAKVGAVTGTALGGLTGLLVGLGTLAIPGVGPIMLAGAAATTLATTLTGAGIGAIAGSLLGALVGLGIPEERAKVYDERVRRGHYLVIIDGTDTEILRAEAILRQQGVEEFGIYDNPDARNASTGYVAPTSTSTDYVTPTPTAARSGVERRAIGVFSHRRDAEAALTDLRDAGFPMSRVSIIAKDANGQGIAGIDVDRTAGAGNKADDGAKTGAATGGVLGGLTGLLVGLGTLAIPGIGPVILGGAAATALATTVAGGAIGAAAGSIVGALVGLGIPEDKARVYGDRFQRGDYLIIIDANEAEIRQAEAILKRRGIEEFAIYDGTDLGEHRPSLDRATDYGTPVVNSDRTNYSTTSTPTAARSGVSRRAIGVFSHRRDAEAALTDLRDAGFPMSRVSIIAKDANGQGIAGIDVDRTAGAGNKADDGAKTGAATGGVLGGLTGLLVGLGTLAIPGIGPVILGGAAATALATTVAGGAIGAAAGSIVGALVGLGIPEDKARVYGDRFQRGDYLIIIDANEAEIRQAEAILKRRGIEEFAIYDGTDLGEHRPSLDRATDYGTPVVNSDRTNYSTGSYTDDPAVVIVDRRDETL